MSFDTTDIERHILKRAISDIAFSRVYLESLDKKLFTRNRKFIITIIQELFKKTPTVISKELFEAELNKRFTNEKDKSYIDKYMTEWILIENSVSDVSSDALIDKLKEKDKVVKISDICSKSLELLQTGNIVEATNYIKSESINLENNIVDDKPLIELIEIDDIRKNIIKQKEHPELFSGIKIGFPTFDRKTGGLFKSEMTLISAVTGVGKSTMLKQIAYNVIMGNVDDPNPLKRFNGKNVLHVTNEEHRDQVRLKYYSLFTRIPYSKFKQATLNDSEMIMWQNKMDELKKPCYGKIFIKEVAQFANVTEIYKEYFNLKQSGHEIELIVLDYLDHLSPVTKAWGENDEQAKKAWDFKALCIDLNIPVITATQAATIVDQKQDRGRKFGKLDIYGSKRPIHASNTFAGIMLTGFDDKQLATNGGTRQNEDECDKFWNIGVAKSRDGATFNFECRHIVETGRVIEEWHIKKETSGKETDEKTEEKSGEEKDSKNLSEEIEEMLKEEGILEEKSKEDEKS